MAQRCPQPAIGWDNDGIQAQKKDAQKLFDLVHPGQIQIFVRTVDEQSVPVIIAVNSSIVQFKQELERKLSIPVKEQRLLYTGQLLDNKRTLEYYNLRSDSVVRLGT